MYLIVKHGAQPTSFYSIGKRLPGKWGCGCSVSVISTRESASSDIPDSCKERYLAWARASSRTWLLSLCRRARGVPHRDQDRTADLQPGAISLSRCFPGFLLLRCPFCLPRPSPSCCQPKSRDWEDGWQGHHGARGQNVLRMHAAGAHETHVCSVLGPLTCVVAGLTTLYD